LIGQEFEARRMEFQTFLDDMNLQAEIATQLASEATAQLGANARIKAQLDAQAAAGAGAFFQRNLAGPISSAVSGMFGGGGGGAASNFNINFNPGGSASQGFIF